MKDYIGYQALTDAALRSVVRDVLRRAEKQGLIGAHHFYLTFRTDYPGVEIPEFLSAQYPDEMTIILQHQFWGLKVTEDYFEVSLSFRKVPASLHIPFAALVAFADLGVQFGLQFRGETTGAVASLPAPAPVAALPSVGETKPSKQKTKPAAVKDAQAADDATPAAPVEAEVVSLDAFRKK